MKLKELIENPDNPSIATDEEFARLQKKIDKIPSGLRAMRIAYVTDTIDGQKVVISGNKRLRALKQKFGDDYDIPDEWTQDVTDMSKEERKEFIVIANTADGHWDAKKLLEQYDTNELADIMPGEAIDLLLRQTADMTRYPSIDDTLTTYEDEKTYSKPGEIYQLGQHRLICGDSTKKETFDKLLDGRSVDLVVTDPPYGISVRGKTDGKLLTIKNDDLTRSKLKDFLVDVFNNIRDCLKPGGVFYIYKADSSGVDAESIMALEQTGMHYQTSIVWAKNMASFSCGRLDYSRQHEVCMYGWKKGAEHYFAKLEEYCTTFDSADKIDTSKMTKEKLKELCDIFLCNYTSLLYEKKPSRNALHPTMKPITLFKRHIQHSSRPGELVLDPFLGSGTTLIAADETGRTCYGIEFDPYYADRIRQRYAEYKFGEGCDWQKLTPPVNELEAL